MKYLNIIQINKGSSNLPKHLELIKKLVNDENPSVIVMPESQIKRKESVMRTAFKNYNVEHKFRTGHDQTRISVFIKDSIEYSRLTDIENSEDSMIWLQIKTGPSKFLTFMGGYREWQIPGEANSITQMIFRITLVS